MTTIPTENAVPSELPRDLKFNAGKIDEFVTSLQLEYEDRFGGKHYTIEGLRWVAQRAIAEYGYITIDSFQAGANLTLPNQVLRDTASGEYYRWDGELPKSVPANSTPVSTGGIGAGKWLSVGDAALRADLTSSNGASLIGTSSGINIQEDLNKINTQNSSLAYIESFANLVVENDWSDAIQAAFDTGKVVVGKAGKTYNVSKIISTQGQQFIGSLSLKLNRSSITATSFTAEYSKADSNYFRGIYVQSAYDLCELLRIKSMGFNTILHYCYFDNSQADLSGTIPKLVKNAATAGLNVVINTENSEEHNNGTVSQLVSNADGFSNVIGYSVLDEPASRGISLATQESAIKTLRALTTKKLFCVDYLWAYLNTWTKPWSYNYDVFLVDSYSMYYASGTASENLNKDLGKMRADFGAALKMTGKAHVIPCFQAYAITEASPVEGANGSYASDIDQIVAASKVFGKVGNGDYACFVWDGGMETNVSNNTKLQEMIKEVNNHAGTGESYVTNPIIFGGVASVYQRSLSDIAEKIHTSDPNNTTDSWLGGGAWPVRVTTGSSETPLHTTTANIDISGIGFKQGFSRLVTNHNALQYVTAYGVFENYGATLTGTAALNLYTTPDGGYNQNLIYSGGVTAGSSFRLSSKTTNSYDGVGEDLVIGLALSSSADYLTNYRRIIYGMFVSTNW